MRRIRTRLIYVFEHGRSIDGWSIKLGRFGTIIFLR